MVVLLGKVRYEDLDEPLGEIEVADGRLGEGRDGK
jgi:hypothetical protein